MLSPTAQSDVLKALSTGFFPEEFWDCQDDACDCTYQRIGMWTNPYIGETLEVRMCCIWAELYKLFPDFVRVVPAYLDGNANEWDTQIHEWNAEFDMPKSIWYRQMARKDGISVAEARSKYRERDEERPRGTPKPKEIPRLGMAQVLAIQLLTGQIAELQSQIGQILSEAGLDPSLTWAIQKDGTAVEVQNEHSS